MRGATAAAHRPRNGWEPLDQSSRIGCPAPRQLATDPSACSCSRTEAGDPRSCTGPRPRISAPSARPRPTTLVERLRNAPNADRCVHRTALRPSCARGSRRPASRRRAGPSVAPPGRQSWGRISACRVALVRSPFSGLDAGAGQRLARRAPGRRNGGRRPGGAGWRAADAATGVASQHAFVELECAREIEDHRLCRSCRTGGHHRRCRCCVRTDARCADTHVNGRDVRRRPERLQRAAPGQQGLG